MVKNPIQVFDLLFFAVFGMTTTEQLKTTDWMRTNNNQPLWTDVLFKVTFAIYMLVSVVVLINLLIAMMTDTYQRIQVIFFLEIFKVNFLKICCKYVILLILCLKITLNHTRFNF